MNLPGTRGPATSFSAAHRSTSPLTSAPSCTAVSPNGPPFRQTIRRLWEAGLLRVFDVNLRPPFDDRSAVEASLRAADVVKCNDGEPRRLQDWFDLPDDPGRGAVTVIDPFDCSALGLTP